MITFTPTGSEVREEALTHRVMSVREVQDFRLEQTAFNAYRIQVLPKKTADIRALKGSVLDALVDVYGIKASYDIDIITEDATLMPQVQQRATIRDNISRKR